MMLTTRSAVTLRACARRMSASNSRAAASARRAGRKRLSASGNAAVSAAMIAITTRSSSSVKPPRASSRLGSAQITGISLAAFLLVRPERIDVVVARLARNAVFVRFAPRVDQALLLLYIGSVPVRQIAGLLNQGLQRLVVGRIAPVVDVEGVDRRAKRVHLDLCGLHLCLPQVLGDLRRGDGRNQREDQQHDH